jgi:hypothetical protein
MLCSSNTKWRVNPRKKSLPRCVISMPSEQAAGTFRSSALSQPRHVRLSVAQYEDVSHVFRSFTGFLSTVFTLPVGRLLSYFGVVPHGHVLDIPNAALGVIYYTWHILLSDVSQLLTSAMTILAFLSTVFLAYQLTFILHELCILCWSTHVINTWLMYKMVHSSNRSDKTKSS